MNKEVTENIQQAPEAQRQAMIQLRALIALIVPEAKETIKWGRPVFSTDKDFAYFKAGSKALTLGFFNRKMLSDPIGQLEGTGASMCHIKIKNTEDLQSLPIAQWITESAQ